MNVDNEEVLQQSVLLIYTVPLCQWLEEMFTEILSPKPGQHAREVVCIFKDKKTEGERTGKGERGDERERLPLIPWYAGEIASNEIKHLNSR